MQRRAFRQAVSTVLLAFVLLSFFGALPLASQGMQSLSGHAFASPTFGSLETAFAREFQGKGNPLLKIALLLGLTLIAVLWSRIRVTPSILFQTVWSVDLRHGHIHFLLPRRQTKYK